MKIGHIKMSHSWNCCIIDIRLYNYPLVSPTHLENIPHMWNRKNKVAFMNIFQNWEQKINVHLVSPTHLTNLPQKLGQEMKTLFLFPLVNILQNAGPNENLLFLYYVVSPFINRTKKLNPLTHHTTFLLINCFLITFKTSSISTNT
jgi:hypothetical protein